MPKPGIALVAALSVLGLAACREPGAETNAAQGATGAPADASPSDPAPPNGSSGPEADPVPPPDAVSHPDGYLPDEGDVPTAGPEPTAAPPGPRDPPPATEDQHIHNRQSGS